MSVLGSGSPPEVTQARRIFVAGFQRWLVAGTWTGFLLLGLAGLSAEPAGTGSWWFALGLASVSFLLVVRSLYAFSLTLTASALVVRSWEKTNTISLAEIVAVRTGLVSSVIGVENHVLFVTTRDGRERRFVSISGSQNPRKPIHDLPRAVELIRRALPT
ncbi:MAG: hypothetical protein ACOYOQ_14650 [Microthrixaceae bacterium]